MMEYNTFIRTQLTASTCGHFCWGKFREYANEVFKKIRHFAFLDAKMRRDNKAVVYRNSRKSRYEGDLKTTSVGNGQFGNNHLSYG